MNKLIPVVIAVAVVVGGGAFFGGMKYAQSKSSQGQFSGTGEASGNHAGGSGFRGGARGGAGGGFTAGEILSKDDKSVTVKMMDGGSKIVFLSDSTEITKSATGALSDLEVGKNITVNGTANSDGSVTAQMIQIRPNLPNQSPEQSH